MATGYQGYQGAVGYGDPARAQVDRKRQIAELLQQGATDTSPKSFWEGAAQLGKAFIARGANERADQAERAYGTDKARRLAQFFNPGADDQGRNMAPDVNVSADPAPAPAQANPNIRSIAAALGGVHEGTGKTHPMGMTAAPMADVGAAPAPPPGGQMPSAPTQGENIKALAATLAPDGTGMPGPGQISMADPVSMPMTAAQMPKAGPDRAALMQQALRYTNGDFQQAAAMVEAKLGPAPKPKEYMPVQYGNKGVGAFDPTSGTMNPLVEPMAEAPALKEYDYKEVNGRVLAINKNDPTDQKDMGAATPKGSGASGEPSAYQLWQMQRAEEQDGIKANERDMAAAAAVTNLKDGQQRVSDLITHAGFKGIYGPFGAFGINMGAKPTNVMNQDELNAMALLDQVGGEAFLAGVQKMRGTGPLSDNEGKRVSAAVTRLTNRMQSPEAAQAAAVEFRDAMQGLERAYARESGGAPAPAQVQQPNMLDQIGGAVGGFMQNMMGGNRQPAPQQAAPVRVNSPQERDALPPGTQYVAPDGSVKIKR